MTASLYADSVGVAKYYAVGGFDGVDAKSVEMLDLHRESVQWRVAARVDDSSLYDAMAVAIEGVHS